jgi:uncharacterized membrane protein
MYKIIGGDQKEYGPVGAEQIRRWVQEGRANADTQVQLEGQSDWRPLSAFPEFAAALGAQAQVASTPPTNPTVSAQAVIDPALSSATTLDVGSCFGRSWALLQKHFWLVVGACAIVHLISIALGFVPYVGWPVQIVLSGVLSGGVYALFLKLVRGQPAVLGDVFTGFQLATVPLMLTGAIAFILTCIGFVFCIVPGVYLLVSWLFALPLVIDKRLDFWPAMETSRQVVGKQWWLVLALGFLCLLSLLAGMLACIIGVFIALPFAYGAIAYAYADMFNPKTPATSGTAPAAPAPSARPV